MFLYFYVMGLRDEQIPEKGRKWFSGKSCKWIKTQSHRKHRRKSKQSLEYTPQYNRYSCGWVR